jgi:hypothetical protein
VADDDEKKPGMGMKVVASVGLAASALFLANLPMFPPEIPDILPLVGNLDELLASAVFLWSARTLGIKPLELLRGRKERKRLAAAKKALPG